MRVSLRLIKVADKFDPHSQLLLFQQLVVQAPDTDTIVICREILAMEHASKRIALPPALLL